MSYQLASLALDYYLDLGRVYRTEKNLEGLLDLWLGNLK